MRALQARYSPRHVHVRLAYMEGLTVKQQAEMWSRVSVVVHIHGAALGELLLPACTPSRA